MSRGRWLAASREQAVNAVLRLPSRRLRAAFVRRVLAWPMGESVFVGRGVRVQNVRGITLGARVVIHRGSQLDLRGGIVVGDDVALAPGVTILTADHDPDSPTREYRTRGVTIGARAWLATGAMVLPGTTIGDGVVLAAGAVAHGHLEPWGIYGGNPAVRLRDRDRDAQARLETWTAPWQ